MIENFAQKRIVKCAQLYLRASRGALERPAASAIDENCEPSLSKSSLGDPHSSIAPSRMSTTRSLCITDVRLCDTCNGRRGSV